MKSVLNEELDQCVILALNSGSSSLKLGLYLFNRRGSRKIVSAEAQQIGSNGGRVVIDQGTGHKEELRNFSTITEAVQYLIDRVFTYSDLAPQAIGHRIVHGGPRLREHQRITPEVLQELENATAFAPLHVPRALEIIRSATAMFPTVPQVACFDTAFHRTIPEHAARLPFSRDFWERGVRRYGFHGLSCESIVNKLKSDLPRRTIIAHLGNGCSITAVHNGESLETTMGLTPTGGVIMGTRSGDLDPGVLLYLQQAERYGPTQLDSLLNHKSGLLGISELSSNVRQLLASAEQNKEAQLALKMFCYQVRKSVGSMAAVLGGVDLVVFTGGIGEHAWSVRAEICSGLEYLGIALVKDANRTSAWRISSKESRCEVRVVPSDEDMQIARHCREITRELCPAAAQAAAEKTC